VTFLTDGDQYSTFDSMMVVVLFGDGIQTTLMTDYDMAW